MSAIRHTRIVVFLGDKGYTPSRYSYTNETETIESPPGKLDELPHEIWLQLAASHCSKLPESASLIVFGSRNTWTTWIARDELLRKIGASDRRPPQIVFAGYDVPSQVASGGSRAFWEVFDLMRDVLRSDALVFGECGLAYPGPGLHAGRCQSAGTLPAASQIVLDVTHGFRSFPFIAGAALDFALSEQRRRRRDKPSSPLPEYRILYAAEEAAEKVLGKPLVPVWDLTPVAEANRLSMALDAFVRYGKADLLADVMAESRNEACGKLATPMREFAEDLALLRVPELLAGSIHRLVRALDENWTGLSIQFSPLIAEMGQFREDLRSITTKSLQPISVEGIIAAGRLARLLVRVDHFTGAWGILREELVNIWTISMRKEWKQPHSVGFNKERINKGGLEDEMRERGCKLARDHGEVFPGDQPCHVADDAAELAAHVIDARNDVLHCGHRDLPNDRAALKEKLNKYLARFDAIVTLLEKGRST